MAASLLSLAAKPKLVCNHAPAQLPPITSPNDVKDGSRWRFTAPLKSQNEAGSGCYPSPSGRTRARVTGDKPGQSMQPSLSSRERVLQVVAQLSRSSSRQKKTMH